MLVTFFLNLAYNIASSFFNLFSDAETTVLSNIYSSATTTSAYLSSINSFVPVSTIIIIVGLFLSIEIIILFIKIINWIIRKIPTIS
jgi:uncharacterized membrane protein